MSPRHWPMQAPCCSPPQIGACTCLAGLHSTPAHCREKAPACLARPLLAHMSSMMLLSGRYTLHGHHPHPAVGTFTHKSNKTDLEGRGITTCTRPYCKEARILPIAAPRRSDQGSSSHRASLLLHTASAPSGWMVQPRPGAEVQTSATADETGKSVTLTINEPARRCTSSEASALDMSLAASARTPAGARVRN